MDGDTEVIELLNEVLTAELTAINQYFVDAKMFDNWGYERLAKRFRDESIDEMKDADELIERILYLDGVPNLQRLGTVRVGETPAEKLQLALELETRGDRPAQPRHRPVRRARRQRQPRPARGHPRGRGGPRRLARVPARADPPGRRRALPRPADPRLTARAPAPVGAAPVAWLRSPWNATDPPPPRGRRTGCPPLGPAGRRAHRGRSGCWRCRGWRPGRRRRDSRVGTAAPRAATVRAAVRAPRQTIRSARRPPAPPRLDPHHEGAAHSRRGAAARGQPPVAAIAARTALTAEIEPAARDAPRSPASPYPAPTSTGPGARVCGTFPTPAAPGPPPPLRRWQS